MVEKGNLYLNNLIEEIKYNELMTVYISEDRCVYGVISPKTQKNILTKWFEVKTLMDSIENLDKQIKLSFLNSMDYAYSKELRDNFNPIK